MMMFQHASSSVFRIQRVWQAELGRGRRRRERGEACDVRREEGVMESATYTGREREKEREGLER